MTEWLHYWKAPQVRAALEEGTLAHIASDNFARVVPGDRVWVIGSGGGHDLFTLGYVDVPEVVSLAEAKRRVTEPWEAKWHIFATKPTPAAQISLRNIIHEIRFISRGTPTFTLDVPIGQQLQQLRKVTPESARLLAETWGRESGTPPTANTGLLPLIPGEKYSRTDLFSTLGVPRDTKGGTWFTGYNAHQGQHFIFCNVGTAGRTGHDYDNEWLGLDRIRWFGKTGSRANQPVIRAMTSGSEPVYFFWREHDRDDFTFAGMASPEKVAPRSSPVEVIWRLSTSGFLSHDPNSPSDSAIPPAAPSGDELNHLLELDGERRTKTRRDQAIIRRALIGESNAAACAICGNEFPAELLIAAHIKRRSDCTDAEKRDYKNNVMLLCVFGCDDLFERGYVIVKNGHIAEGITEPSSPTVRMKVTFLKGKSCSAWTALRGRYFEAHRSRFTQ